MEVLGKVKAGVVYPVEPLNVPDGTTVALRVAEAPNPYGDFWENVSLDELVRRQGTKPITSIEQLQSSEPVDEKDWEGFEEWLREVRR